MDERSFVKAGAVSAILGAALLLLSTALHPLDADPGDAAAAFREYASDGRYTTTHLGQFFGVLLMVGGLFALQETLARERAGWLARLGMLAGIASLAVTAVLQAVDGIALKAMVDAWVTAPDLEKSEAYRAALAVRHVEVGVASLTALLFGLTILLFGLAVAFTSVYPRWLGWLGTIGAMGMLSGGLVTAHDGFSHVAMAISAPFNLSVVAWIVVMGALMWRRPLPG